MKQSDEDGSINKGTTVVIIVMQKLNIMAKHHMDIIEK
jgi:hypothetical protein